MDALILARLQFGATTLYHFVFVPLTIGLAPLVAIMQTAYLRTRNQAYRRMARLFGTLFVINFAMGVATGLVQEFQFGMNWSSYSRFVGDVFGVPLAIEGLLAFFLESTLLGLWIFGEGRLPEKLHAATIWMVALGSTFSAFFILAANSWMQNPAGYAIDPVTHRAVMHDSSRSCSTRYCASHFLTRCSALT
jgi:cytochrome bd ubiquinol oxidase subunit I